MRKYISFFITLIIVLFIISCAKQQYLTKIEKNKILIGKQYIKNRYHLKNVNQDSIALIANRDIIFYTYILMPKPIIFGIFVDNTGKAYNILESNLFNEVANAYGFMLDGENENVKQFLNFYFYQVVKPNINKKEIFFYGKYIESVDDIKELISENYNITEQQMNEILLRAPIYVNLNIENNENGYIVKGVFFDLNYLKYFDFVTHISLNGHIEIVSYQEIFDLNPLFKGLINKYID